MVEVHWSNLTILAGAIKSLFYLVLSLVSLLFGQFLIVLTHSVDR